MFFGLRVLGKRGSWHGTTHAKWVLLPLGREVYRKIFWALGANNSGHDCLSHLDSIKLATRLTFTFRPTTNTLFCLFVYVQDLPTLMQPCNKDDFLLQPHTDTHTHAHRGPFCGSLVIKFKTVFLSLTKCLFYRSNLGEYTYLVASSLYNRVSSHWVWWINI